MSFWYFNDLLYTISYAIISFIYISLQNQLFIIYVITESNNAAQSSISAWKTYVHSYVKKGTTKLIPERKYLKPCADYDILNIEKDTCC